MFQTFSIVHLLQHAVNTNVPSLRTSFTFVYTGRQTFGIRRRLAKMDNQTSVSYVRFSCTSRYQGTLNGDQCFTEGNLLLMLRPQVSRSIQRTSQQEAETHSGFQRACQHEWNTIFSRCSLPKNTRTTTNSKTTTRRVGGNTAHLLTSKVQTEWTSITNERRWSVEPPGTAGEVTHEEVGGVKRDGEYQMI